MFILKGLRFGMLLQLAVGPVCLFIFNLAGNRGWLSAWRAVTAVALVDAVYIVLALLGIVAFVRNERLKRWFQFLGALVVFIYGLQTVLGVWGWRILPQLDLFKNRSFQEPFWQGLILTASNPLTILFWAGVLSAKIMEEHLGKADSYCFGLGCVLATFCFLSVIAFAGSITGRFLPASAILGLNLLVGLVLICFAVRMGLKQDQKAMDSDDLHFY